MPFQALRRKPLPAFFNQNPRAACHQPYKTAAGQNLVHAIALRQPFGHGIRARKDGIAQRDQDNRMQGRVGFAPQHRVSHSQGSG